MASECRSPSTPRSLAPLLALLLLVATMASEAQGRTSEERSSCICTMHWAFPSGERVRFPHACMHAWVLNMNVKQWYFLWKCFKNQKSIKHQHCPFFYIRHSVKYWKPDSENCGEFEGQFLWSLFLKYITSITTVGFACAIRKKWSL